MTVPLPPPAHEPVDGEHPLYAFLLRYAGQDPSDLAIVQCAVFHRPYRDDLGIWVCERCSWCQAAGPQGAAAEDGWPGAEVHVRVGAYAPCEELRLLAWPWRKQPGYHPDWAPQECPPTNPPTLLGGNAKE